MANNKQKKSVFSLFGMFKSRRPRRFEDFDDVGSTGRKNWRSDEDKGFWVAEPGIDSKASAFISKFYAARILEAECHAVYQAS